MWSEGSFGVPASMLNSDAYYTITINFFYGLIKVQVVKFDLEQFATKVGL